ncbi:cation diffusion facilitator family transporter [Deinococcus sonorensis]|uniref:Cation transporter dimerization domain-containing protein n=2 Tax=Deinococcus sonorensis TaxID=309891 RepID=A0AAU7U7K6_9DEIO
MYALPAALDILSVGYRLVRGSLKRRLDEAAPLEVQQRISRYAHGALGAHDVRTRRAGQVTFIECHLVVPGEMPVEVTHRICEALKDSLRRVFQGSLVTIHVEPESKANPQGIVVR